MVSMAKPRKNNGSNGKALRRTDAQNRPVRNRNRGRRSMRAIAKGAVSVVGAAQLAVAGAHDMLEGNLDVREAAVLNSTAGRVLKAAEITLRFGNKPVFQGK